VALAKSAIAVVINAFIVYDTGLGNVAFPRNAAHDHLAGSAYVT
jgi:hypothetical protein